MKTSRLPDLGAGTPRPITPEQIAALAYELWQERGCPEGSDMDIWLEAERQLNGGPRKHTEVDPIPADPDNVDADSDPALNSATDRELRSIGGAKEQRSPTALSI